MKNTSTITATTEQNKILDAANAGNNLIVSAFAGTGKTSTIKMLSDSIVKPSLYLVFSKENQIEARAKLKKHVDVRTVHSFAWKLTMKNRQLEKAINRNLLSELFIKNGLFNNNKDARKFLNQYVLPLMTKLCQSEYKTPDVFRKQDGYYMDMDAELWSLVIKGYSIVKTQWEKQREWNHDWYLKQAQLGKAAISDYDVVYLDESQDSNPVTLGILDRFPSTTQIVVVGDSHQAIYEWRGAIDALKSPRFDSYEKLYLSIAFRYTQEIADVANDILRVTGENQKITGTDKTMPENPTKCMLSRTNIGVIKNAEKLSQDGIKWRTNINLQQIVDTMFTIYEYYKVKDTEVMPKCPTNPHRDIWGLYESFEEIKASGLYSIECLLCEAGYYPGQILKLKNNQSLAGTEEWFLSTSHKSKGLEWDIVIVDDDMIPKDGSGIDKSEAQSWIKDQGLNLLYVACTRPRVKLILSDKIKDFIHSLYDILNRE